MQRPFSQIVAPETARLLGSIQKQVFKPFPNTSLALFEHAVEKPRTCRQKLLNHYNPDFNFVKLAASDPRFADLDLKDEILEARLEREARLLKKGKAIRVSAITGVNIPSGGFKIKKKKKR